MATQDIKVVLSATDKTRAAFDSAKRNMAGLSASAGNLTRTLGLALPALTGAGFVAMAKGAIDAADSLKDMSERTLVSVKDIASLKLVAEQSGTELESVAKGIQKITLSVGQAQSGNKEMAESLKRLGVTSGDARERLFQIADAYAASSDKAKITADIQKVLSKSYAELVPLFSQGGDELRKAAAASESFADAMARLAPDADKFNDQMAKFKENAAGAAAQMTSAVLPSLNEYLGALDRILEKGTLLEKLGFFTVGFIPAHILDEQATTAEELGNRIASYRVRIDELKASGKDASKEIAIFNGLLEKQIKILQTPPKSAANQPAPITVKPATTTKTDPLASFLKATDTARLKEYNTLTAELLRRMANANGDTTVYVQALDEINEKFKDVNGIQAMTDEQEFMAMVQEDGAKTAKEWADNLRELSNVDMDRLTTMLANTDFARLKQDQEDMILLAKAFSEGIKDADGNLRQLSESEYLDAVKNRLGLVAAETEKAKSFAEEFGLVFESAFTKGIEAAVQGTGNFSDVVKGLASDIVKLIAQMLILEPLLKSIKDSMSGAGSSSGSGFNFGSLFSDIGSGIASFFGFEQGGVMTPAGPLALKKYANGGIANTPQFALFGEGSMNEAYVPLPDGRRIPVAMQGGGRQIVNNITITAKDPTEVRLSRGAQMADITRALRHANRWS